MPPLPPEPDEVLVIVAGLKLPQLLWGFPIDPAPVGSEQLTLVIILKKSPFAPFEQPNLNFLTAFPL